MATRSLRSTGGTESLNPAMIHLLDANRLRKELEQKGLDTTGTKSVLADRLQEAVDNERLSHSAHFISPVPEKPSPERLIAVNIAKKALKRRIKKNAEIVEAIEERKPSITEISDISRVQLLKDDIADEAEIIEESFSIEFSAVGDDDYYESNESSDSTQKLEGKIETDVNRKKQKLSSQNALQKGITSFPDLYQNALPLKKRTTGRESSTEMRLEPLVIVVKEEMEDEFEEPEHATLHSADSRKSFREKLILPYEVITSNKKQPEIAEPVTKQKYKDCQDRKRDADAIPPNKISEKPHKKMKRAEMGLKNKEIIHENENNGLKVKRIRRSSEKHHFDKSVIVLHDSAKTILTTKKPVRPPDSISKMPTEMAKVKVVTDKVVEYSNLQISKEKSTSDEGEKKNDHIVRKKALVCRQAPIDVLDSIIDKQAQLLTSKFKTEQERAEERQRLEIAKRRQLQSVVKILPPPMEKRRHTVDFDMSSTLTLDHSPISSRSNSNPSFSHVLLPAPPPPPVLMNSPEFDLSPAWSVERGSIDEEMAIEFQPSSFPFRFANRNLIRSPPTPPSVPAYASPTDIAVDAEKPSTSGLQSLSSEFGVERLKEVANALQAVFARIDKSVSEISTDVLPETHVCSVQSSSMVLQDGMQCVCSTASHEGHVHINSLLPSNYEANATNATLPATQFVDKKQDLLHLDNRMNSPDTARHVKQNASSTIPSHPFHHSTGISPYVIKEEPNALTGSHLENQVAKVADGTDSLNHERNVAVESFNVNQNVETSPGNFAEDYETDKINARLPATNITDEACTTSLGHCTVVSACAPLSEASFDQVTDANCIVNQNGLLRESSTAITVNIDEQLMQSVSMPLEIPCSFNCKLEEGEICDDVPLIQDACSNEETSRAIQSESFMDISFANDSVTMHSNSELEVTEKVTTILPVAEKLSSHDSFVEHRQQFSPATEQGLCGAIVNDPNEHSEIAKSPNIPKELMMDPRLLLQKASDVLKNLNSADQPDESSSHYEQMAPDPNYELEDEDKPLPEFHGEPVPDSDDEIIIEGISRRKTTTTKKNSLEEEESPPGEEHVELDFYNADIHIKASETDPMLLDPDNGDGFALMWGGVRATYGIKITDDISYLPRVAFQAKIKEFLSVKHIPFEELDPHDIRIGFSVSNTPTILGECPQSFAFSSLARKAVNNVFVDYGEPFHVDDIITAVLDVQFGEISFWKNDLYLGPAFSNVRFEPGDIVFPHICTKNCKVAVNFGNGDVTEWKELPLEQQDVPLQPLIFFDNVSKDSLVRGSIPPSSKAECTVLMMVGLPGVGKTTWVRQYLRDHPTEQWTLLNTDTILTAMKVNGIARTRVHQGRWDMVMGLTAKALTRSLHLACRRRRNYIIDQTNVSKDARKRKLSQFKDFQRKCVVIIPSDEEMIGRQQRQARSEGIRPPPAEAMLELKATFSIPNIETEPIEDVYLVEPPIDQIGDAMELVQRYNEEGKPWFQRKRGRTADRRGSNGGRSNDYVRSSDQRASLSGVRPTSASSSNLVPPMISIESRDNTPSASAQPSPIIARPNEGYCGFGGAIPPSLVQSFVGSAASSSVVASSHLSWAERKGSLV